jgi:hypothetical protein
VPAHERASGGSSRCVVAELGASLQCRAHRQTPHDGRRDQDRPRHDDWRNAMTEQDPNAPSTEEITTDDEEGLLTRQTPGLDEGETSAIAGPDWDDDLVRENESPGGQTIDTDTVIEGPSPTGSGTAGSEGAGSTGNV